MLVNREWGKDIPRCLVVGDILSFEHFDMKVVGLDPENDWVIARELKYVDDHTYKLDEHPSAMKGVTAWYGAHPYNVKQSEEHLKDCTILPPQYED